MQEQHDPCPGSGCVEADSEINIQGQLHSKEGLSEARTKGTRERRMKK